MFLKPEALQNRVEAWLERELSALQPLMEARERLQTQLQEGFAAGEDRVLELASKGRITDEQLSRQLETITRERGEAEARMTELEEERDRGIDHITDFKTKRDILRAVQERGVESLRRGGVESAAITPALLLSGP